MNTSPVTLVQSLIGAERLRPLPWLNGGYLFLGPFIPLDILPVLQE